MFKTNRIVEEKIKEDTIKKTRSELSYVVSSSLSFFSRRTYDKINESISEIVRTIEEETGWKYIDNYFVYRDHFALSHQTNEITYQTHKVSLNGEKITISSEKPIVMDFVRKYGRLLQQLQELEKKKEKIEGENLERIAKRKKAISLESLYQPDKEQLEKEQDFVQYQAAEFSNKYGSRGECLLMIWLEKFSSGEPPMKYYNEIKKIQLPESGKEALLGWISTYTTGGEKVFDRLMNEKTAAYVREMRAKIDAFPYMGEGVL